MGTEQSEEEKYGDWVASADSIVAKISKEAIE